MKKLFVFMSLVCASQVQANSPQALVDFAFERYASGQNASITPKAQVVWQQALATVSHDEIKLNNEKIKITDVQTDGGLRIGVGHDAEVRVGWQGWQWQRTEHPNHQQREHQVGDMNIGIKKRFVKDDDLHWAVLAQADLATGQRKLGGERHHRYQLISAVDYHYNQHVQTSMTMKYAYQNKDLTFTTVPAIRYKISDYTVGYAEYVGQKAESQKWQSRVNQGVLLNVTDNAQIDAWVGYGFSESLPRYHAGLGFSYRFD